MPRYKSNYLTEVILRIDFLNTVTDYQQSIPKDIEDEILKYFTLKEPKKGFTEEIKFEAFSGKVERQKTEFNEWNFFANEKKKRLCLTKDTFFLLYNRYLNFEDLTVPFNALLKLLNSKHTDLQINRVGMRYINQINMLDGDPFEWGNYLNADLLCIFKIPNTKNDISRAMHILELNIDDIKLKYQYGMHNPDHPASIKKKIFVLDFDAFKLGALSFEEVEHIIPILHEKIELLFEKSITDGLRGKMNE